VLDAELLVGRVHVLAEPRRVGHQKVEKAVGAEKVDRLAQRGARIDEVFEDGDEAHDGEAVGPGLGRACIPGDHVKAVRLPGLACRLGRRLDPVDTPEPDLPQRQKKRSSRRSDVEDPAAPVGHVLADELRHLPVTLDIERGGLGPGGAQVVLG
jgi:hypothetical protein